MTRIQDTGMRDTGYWMKAEGFYIAFNENMFWRGSIEGDEVIVVKDHNWCVFY